MSDTTDREQEIFAEALELTSPEARAAFLQGACGRDAELHQRIDSLLASYSSAHGFIPTRESAN
ncbi:MAG TPA: hypothetical protein VGR78_11055, partial [Verrucomicrobiae bacterium]|nr:hypothetical protein [Verrucomicrobiae bacterium]